MTATTTAIAMMGVDIISIAILIFGVYFPRYRRADLVVAFLGVNIGVFAVAQVLATTTAGMALGVGLFGVLSIIRLRSTEISQKEVAYYFAALTIGLITGLGTLSILPIAFITMIVLALAAAESVPALRNYDELEIMLDHCIIDEKELSAELTRMLNAEIKGVRVIKHDMVNDTSLVQVRFVRDNNAAHSASRREIEAGVSNGAVNNGAVPNLGQRHPEFDGSDQATGTLNNPLAVNR